MDILHTKEVIVIVLILGILISHTSTTLRRRSHIDGERSFHAFSVERWVERSFSGIIT